LLFDRLLRRFWLCGPPYGKTIVPSGMCPFACPPLLLHLLKVPFPRFVARVRQISTSLSTLSFVFARNVVPEESSSMSLGTPSGSFLGPFAFFPVSPLLLDSLCGGPCWGGAVASRLFVCGFSPRNVPPPFGPKSFSGIFLLLLTLLVFRSSPSGIVPFFVRWFFPPHPPLDLFPFLHRSCTTHYPTPLGRRRSLWKEASSTSDPMGDIHLPPGGSQSRSSLLIFSAKVFPRWEGFPDQPRTFGKEVNGLRRVPCLLLPFTFLLQPRRLFSWSFFRPFYQEFFLSHRVFPGFELPRVFVSNLPFAGFFPVLVEPFSPTFSFFLPFFLISPGGVFIASGFFESRYLPPTLPFSSWEWDDSFDLFFKAFFYRIPF